MAEERKIFPTASVLGVIGGRNNTDTQKVASYILGKPVTSPEAEKAAAPFAAAWLARWYPKFLDLDWKEDGDWKAFVSQVEARLGANISLTPLSGRLKELASQTMDAIRDTQESLLRQTEAAAALERKLHELQPLAAAMKAMQKKNDELEEKLKAMKTEMGALQRKIMDFEGKLPIDGDELMATIKSAIKDGLKGLSVAAGAASAAIAGESEAQATAPAAPVSEEDEWDAAPRRDDEDDEWG